MSSIPAELLTGFPDLPKGWRWEVSDDGSSRDWPVTIRLRDSRGDAALTVARRNHRAIRRAARKLLRAKATLTPKFWGLPS